MIIRQSHVVLILKLIGVEMLLAFLYLVIRLPKTIFLFDYSNDPSNLFLPYIGLGYFIILSLVELFLVLKVTLDWSNNTYEIRDDSIIHRKGVLTLKEDVYTLRNLGSATIQQGVIGKLLNFGTITLSSPVLKHEFYLLDVHNPGKISQSFDENIENKSQKANIIRKVS